MATLYTNDFAFLGPEFGSPSGGWVATGGIARCTAGFWSPLYVDTTAHAAVADVKVSAKRMTVGTGFGGGVIARSNNANFSGAQFYGLSVSGSDSLGLFRRDPGGTDVELGLYTVAHAAGDKLTLEVTGTGATVTLKAYVNDVLVATTTDTSGNRITAAGQTGLFSWATGNQDFDDMLVEDAVAGGGGITGTLACSETGADGLSASGGLSVLGVRLTLRDTDTGALATSLSGLVVSIRSTSNATALLASATNETTDANGVLDFPSAAIGSIGTYVYVTVEKADHSIVASYRTQVIDLNA